MSALSNGTALDPRVQVIPFSYVSREEGEVMVEIPDSWQVQVTPFSFVTGVEWEVEL